MSHSIHHLPAADKVIVLESGLITHFGSFEEVRDAGATFALASNQAGETSKSTEDIVKADTLISEVMTEDVDDEALVWAAEQGPKYSAYNFYWRCTGSWLASTLIAAIVLTSAVQLGSNGYLTRMQTVDFIGSLTSSLSQYLPRRMGTWGHGLQAMQVLPRQSRFSPCSSMDTTNSFL